MLAPEIVEVGALEAAALGDARKFLSQLGFDIDDFGEDTVAVRAVPSLLAGRNPDHLVRELAAEWRGAGPAAGERGRPSGRRSRGSAARTPRIIRKKCLPILYRNSAMFGMSVS